MFAGLSWPDPSIGRERRELLLLFGDTEPCSDGRVVVGASMSTDASQHGRTIAVIGLGYVGLPVAAAFARHGTRVVAFDISIERIEELVAGHDRTRELGPGDLRFANLHFTADPKDLRVAD